MNIVLLEDDSAQLEKLKFVLESENDITVCGAFLSAEETVKNLEEISPDLLLTDINIPGMGGVKLIQKASEILPSMEIIAYTVHNDIETVFDCLKAGAIGYILKSATLSELVDALREAMHGGAPITPQIARAIISELQERDNSPKKLLSAREREILTNAEAGHSYKEVANRLELSVHTIHNHMRKIFKKLHAKNKQDALQKAHERGLI